jgi:uncharacterized membrane protein YcaP (DUF421 family)
VDSQELVMTALRASAIYVLLLVLIRILGKRTVGNFSAFDLIVALMLGELVDEAIYGDVPMRQAVVAIGVVAAWAFADSVASYKSRRIDELTGGKPSVLVASGEVQRHELAANRLNENELWSMLRLQGIDRLEDVRCATLEPNGKLSVIRTDAAETPRKEDIEPLLARLGGEEA